MGRNLALENSFYLQFENAGQTDFVVNLFNAGATGQTTFITNSYWGYNNLFITNLSNSIFTANTLVDILDGLGNVISSISMSAGQTLAQYLLLANPIVDINGNLGKIDIQQVSSQVYDIRVVGLTNMSKIAFSPDPSVTAIPLQATYALENPFVTVQSTIPIQAIKESETGNSYRILSVQVYSQDTNQILEGLNYRVKDVNGNRVIERINPIIDPYALGITLSILEVGGLIIDTQTILSYKIRAQATSRLTFNYIKGNVVEMKGLDQAFIQRLIFEYAAQKKILKEERFRELTIQ